jgi:hypothetical protein
VNHHGTTVWPCFSLPRALGVRSLLSSPQNRSDISGSAMGRIIVRLRNRFTCRDCGSHNGVRSRRRIWEYFLSFVLLQPVRCADCFRRGYCLLFVPLIPANDVPGPTTRAPHSSPNDHRAA